MKAGELVTELPAHAQHSPLTDAKIALYSSADVFAVSSARAMLSLATGPRIARLR